MIFSIGDHIEQIVAGKKTQTRRQSGRYQVGHILAVQPRRGEKGISNGKIRIFRKWKECRWDEPYPMRGGGDSADAEGGYTLGEYEALYEKMYPGWECRYAYEFRFFPHSSSGSANK